MAPPQLFPQLERALSWSHCIGLLALAAYHSHGFGRLIKGEAQVLVQNGKLNRENMRRNHISEHDLEEDMRLSAKN